VAPYVIEPPASKVPRQHQADVPLRFLLFYVPFGAKGAMKSAI
jgi:hypothetical protein